MSQTCRALRDARLLKTPVEDRFAGSQHYAARDSRGRGRTYGRIRQLTKAEEHQVAISGEIKREAPRSLAGFGVRLIDDAHMAWMAAEVESEHALHAWLEGARADHTSAYMAYRAAVDREEAAARELQRLCGVAWLYPVRLTPSQ